MRSISVALFVSLLVLGAVGQTTFTTVFNATYVAGSPARFIPLAVPATDANGLSVTVTSNNATSGEISFGLSTNAPCLFEFGGVPTLSGCLNDATGTGAANATVFVPAGVAYLSILNPSNDGFTVSVVAQACTNAAAVGPSCAVPVAIADFGASDVVLGDVDHVTYIELPLITTADGSISTMEVTFSATESFNYTEIIFGSLPEETNVTDSQGDYTVAQPFVALEGAVVQSGQRYFMGLTPDTTANLTVSFNVTLTNCTAGEYYAITEGDDEECVEIGTLNANSAMVIELNDNFFNDNEWGYFKLNTTFFGAASSLSVGALPLSGDLPVMYLRCGNLPTEEDYDAMLVTGDQDSDDPMALFYSADLTDTCTWFLGLHADDGDEENGMDLWLNSLCPHDCNGNGNCTANICHCDDTWTGIDCASAVAPGQSPTDANESTRFWDISEWSPAAWVAVVLIILLIIAVIGLGVGLGVMTKKWNDARRGSYDKL
mmetsp:Transcript_13196/g.52649  ORF Transcript_13196/g.52649 Transcript_13196/m.52649 type:complete len:489 (-) Transcript_13196:49-1515(-)|eukprot:CAMPEP_0114611842 /NCGR_PEP_ID=MMETSP0168-20121206/4322_1 /TAXON_ID=95228 ORGANISM="Vannella sp., Strain DIVA3 517/6/12" /NCGR_SAMPLE_ID=MMETSP0168 /ASSEMBLY_ACC=CAM_ASM_000044 /LENGTH=488 /DNA_ID=CAMNT_0001822823 /DNA_START=47 /DNA_END=1513 /DNA_ORIENTATION=+